MSTLTDRYVWAVLRAIPARQRAELEPEVRALVADAVEARGEDDGAERAALTELGDPELLAARYTDRAAVLIGPRVYPEWRRLLGVLLPIVVPLATVVVTAAAALGGQPTGQLVGTAITAALNVGIQTVFWVTVVFVLIERAGAGRAGLEPWTVDRLPRLPERVGPSTAETVVSVVAIVVGLVLLVWQQVARPIQVEGSGHALFDPALTAFWLPWFLGLLVIEGVLLVARWRVGGYTWALALVNLVLGLAFLVPALKLLQDGALFDPGLETAVLGMGLGPALAPAGVVMMIALVGGEVADIVKGFREAARSRPTPA
jgi:hypothetical protein